MERNQRNDLDLYNPVTNTQPASTKQTSRREGGNTETTLLLTKTEGNKPVTLTMGSKQRELKKQTYETNIVLLF